jgi:hypothetical protein
MQEEQEVWGVCRNSKRLLQHSRQTHLQPHGPH